MTRARYLTLAAYARRIGVREGTVKRWRLEGLPVAFDFGDVGVRLDVEAADAWVYEHRRDSVAIFRTSLVYVVQRASGPVKVGFSTDVERRLREIQLECAEPVRLIAVLPGDKRTELRIHAALARDALGGEWFCPTAILNVIERLGGRNAA